MHLQNGLFQKDLFVELFVRIRIKKPAERCESWQFVIELGLLSSSSVRVFGFELLLEIHTDGSLKTSTWRCSYLEAGY